VVLIDAPSGGRERTLTGPAQVVTTLAWSPDSGTLASGGTDRTVRLWDTVSLKPARALGSHAGPVRCLAWSPEGTTVASAGDDRTVRLWRVTTGPDRQLDAGASRVRGLAWSPDGKRLAWTAARSVRVWEAATGVIRDFKGHTGEVAALAWQPGGQTLASLGDDATARLWDVAPGEVRSFVPLPERTAAFSPDGHLLAGGGPAYALRVWDVATGQALGTVAVLRQDELVVGPDGSYRAPAVLDAELVYVVETERGQETLPPPAFTRTYGWTNDPDRVRLLPPPDRVVRE
jgi:WD40 repeat protein